MLIRAGLMACHDFEFMAKASVCCFVVGYVPSILYAHYVTNTASGYFIAMYVPHFLMIVVFGYRMYQHSICILNDRPGPPPRRKPGPTKKSVKLMVTAYNKSQRQGSSPKPTKKNVKSMITAYDKSQRRGSSLEAITEVADDT